eukprot:2076030-Pleurochrysis_carterae.AAC.3
MHASPLLRSPSVASTFIPQRQETANSSTFTNSAKTDYAHGHRPSDLESPLTGRVFSALLQILAAGIKPYEDTPGYSASRAPYK